MIEKLRPGPHVVRMMAFAAASGFAIVPLMSWLGESLDNDYFGLLGLLLTLPSGAACTYLAFGARNIRVENGAAIPLNERRRRSSGPWSFIKVSALALLLYYGAMLLAVALLEGPNPQDAGYGLLAFILIFGFFIWFVAGLVIGWLVRVVLG